MARPMRPRFERRLAVAPAEAFRRLRSGVATAGGGLRARFAEGHGHAELSIDGPDRHFWSPTLGLEIRPAPGGAIVHGLFGPHPAVWTFFMFLHFAAVTAGVLGLTLAWSQWSLGETAWGLWAAPVALAVSGGAYGASLLGQRMASTQMDAMLAFLDAHVPDVDEAAPIGADRNGAGVIGRR